MSVEQYTAALAKANRVKSARSKARHELCDGRLTVEEALEVECLQGVTVEALVCARHGWGPGRLHRLLRSIETEAGIVINPARPVGALTERQRAALARSSS